MTYLHLDINDIKHYDIPTLISFIVLIATIIFGILFTIYTCLRKETHTGIIEISRTTDANNNNINN